MKLVALSLCGLLSGCGSDAVRSPGDETGEGTGTAEADDATDGELDDGGDTAGDAGWTANVEGRGTCYLTQTPGGSLVTSVYTGFDSSGSGAAHVSWLTAEGDLVAVSTLPLTEYELLGGFRGHVALDEHELALYVVGSSGGVVEHTIRRALRRGEPETVEVATLTEATDALILSRVAQQLIAVDGDLVSAYVNDPGSLTLTFLTGGETVDFDAPTELELVSGLAPLGDNRFLISGVVSPFGDQVDSQIGFAIVDDDLTWEPMVTEANVWLGSPAMIGDQVLGLQAVPEGEPREALTISSTLEPPPAWIALTLPGPSPKAVHQTLPRRGRHAVPGLMPDESVALELVSGNGDKNVAVWPGSLRDLHSVQETASGVAACGELDGTILLEYLPDASLEF